jgi:hypothetical protein
MNKLDAAARRMQLVPLMPLRICLKVAAAAVANKKVVEQRLAKFNVFCAGPIRRDACLMHVNIS